MLEIFPVTGLQTCTQFELCSLLCLFVFQRVGGPVCFKAPVCCYGGGVTFGPFCSPCGVVKPFSATHLKHNLEAIAPPPRPFWPEYSVKVRKCLELLVSRGPARLNGKIHLINGACIFSVGVLI